MGNNSKSPTMNKLSIILLISLVAFSQAISGYSMRFLAKSADPNERATKWCSLLREHWSTCTTGGFAPEGDTFEEDQCLSIVGEGLHHGFNCSGDAECRDKKATFKAIKGCKNAIKDAGKALEEKAPKEGDDQGPPPASPEAKKFCKKLEGVFDGCKTKGTFPADVEYNKAHCEDVATEALEHKDNWHCEKGDDGCVKRKGIFKKATDCIKSTEKKALDEKAPKEGDDQGPPPASKAGKEFCKSFKDKFAGCQGSKIIPADAAYHKEECEDIASEHLENKGKVECPPEDKEECKIRSDIFTLMNNCVNPKKALEEKAAKEARSSPLKPHIIKKNVKTLLMSTWKIRVRLNVLQRTRRSARLEVKSSPR